MKTSKQVCEEIYAASGELRAALKAVLAPITEQRHFKMGIVMLFEPDESASIPTVMLGNIDREEMQVLFAFAAVLSQDENCVEKQIPKPH